MATKKKPEAEQAEYDALRDELARYDEKLAPLDDELAQLQRVLADTGDRIEHAEAELRIDQIQDERLPIWDDRQRVARRFAVVQAVRDERRRRAARADRARREIERGELKAEILRVMAEEVFPLFVKLVPSRRVAGALPGPESAFGLLGRLVFGRLAPGAGIHTQVHNELDRARRDLAEAEEVV